VIGTAGGAEKCAVARELGADDVVDYASEDLIVPEVIRPYVSERVLVLERIHGRKLDESHGLPPERACDLARIFFSAYVRQVSLEARPIADLQRHVEGREVVAAVIL